MCNSMSTSVRVCRQQAVGRVGKGCHSYSVVLPDGPFTCLEQHESVGRTVIAAFDGSFYVRVCRGKDQSDFLLQSVGAGTACDCGDKSHCIGSFRRINRRSVVTVAGAAVAETPPRRLDAFAGAHGRYPIHRDGAVVAESHLELTVVDSDGRVEQRQREACSCKCAHAEVACGIVDEREVTVIGNIVVCRHINTLTRRESGVAQIAVPSVGESRGGGKHIAGHIAAAFGRHAFSHTVEGEIGITVMRSFVTIVSCQADIYRLASVCTHVEPHGSPVFPKAIFAVGVPSQVLVGYEVGCTADGVDQLHVLVQKFETESRLIGCVVHRVLHHSGIAHYEQIECHGVDIQGIGDCLGLAAFCVGNLMGVPIAEAYRGSGTVGHGMQHAAGAGIAFCRIEVDGVSAYRTCSTRVYHPDVPIRVAVAACKACDVIGREVCWIDTSCATGRGEEADTVGIPGGAESGCCIIKT